MKKKNGFTLIELVIVIAILGILASLAIMRILDSMASARGAKVVADLRTLDSAITVYDTANGTNLTTLDDLVNSQVANIPTPPEGNFTVITTAGKEKEYDSDTYNATTYTLDADTQRAWYCGHPVEYYLNGASSAATFADYASTITKEMAAAITIAKTIDSNAPGSQRVATITKALAEQGINLSSLGANTWVYIKNNGNPLLYFTPASISGLTPGTPVPVICYNPASGNYTVYTSKVISQHVSNINNGADYNALGTSGLVAYKPSTGSSANGNQSYASALAYYNTLAGN